MEIKNGALGYTLTLDNKQVQQILAQTRADFARTNEYAVAEMNKVQNKMNSIYTLGGTFLSVSAAKGFVTELIHVRGEFQQIENAIETITGSQDKMNSLMTEWKDLTLRSPFRLSEIAQSGKQLLAYGVEVEKVTSDIEMLGNIASGVSAPINDIAYLYGTLKTQGRAYQQDINQFTGRGIPIIKELAKQFGVAESEVRAMTEAGKIGFPEVEKALRAMTSEGGQFFNLIGKQATTLTGAVNRLKHEFELMFNEIGADSEGLLSGGINVVTHLVENYKELGKTLGVLITTYGAYKAAVVVADLANTTEATMVKNTIDGLRTSNTVIAKRITLEYDKANATLNSAKAEEIASRAVLKTSRENLNALTIDREKALAKLNAADKAKAAADIEVAAAQKQVDVYKDSIYIGKQREAQQRLEEATTKRNALAKDVNTASTEYNTVAEKTNTASKTLNANVSDLQSKKQAVAVATKNADTIATTRLTFSQKLNVAWTELATAATNAWNASLLSNPIVFVTVGVVGLASSIYLLSQNIDGAKDAQDRFNDSQQKNSKDLEGFTQDIRGYIQTIQDSTKSQSEQIQAYIDLNSLRTNSFKDLSIEEIKLLSVADAQSRINKEISIYKSNQINSNIKDLQSRIEELNKSLNDEINLWERMRLSDELQKTGSLLEEQLYTQEDINHANKLASMSKQEQIVYLTELINKYDENINKTKRIGDNLIQGTTFLNSANTATNLWNLSMSNVATNADYILNRIQGWKATLNSLTKDSDKALGKSYGDRNYTDWTTIRDNAVSKQRDLGSNKKETKEWQDLQKEIDEANNALKAWERTKTKSAKKTKSPKKSDDPVEIFKKQVQGMKDEYDRYVNYMNTDDIVLKATADFKFMSLKKQGGNYEEYLRNIQKQLANVTNKTKTQVGQLQYVNDELSKIIDYNAFDKYKEGINEQIDSSENLLKVIGLLQEEKQKFANSSDQNDKDKFKFLDEKEIDVIKKTDDAAKSLFETLYDAAHPIESINKKFDKEIELLKYKLEQAKTDIEKQKIRVEIERVETNKQEALDDTPTNDAEVNEILKKYQTLEQKKQQIKRDSDREIKKIETEMFNEVDSEKIANYTATIEEIKAKQKEALQAVDSEILKKSKGWIQIFGDYSNKSGAQLRKILDQIRTELNNPNSKLSEQDKKALQDQFKGIKEKLEKDNPFDALISSFDVFKDNLKKGFKDIDGSVNLDSIRGLINDIQGAVNETLNMAEDLGINISDSTKDAVQLGADLFNAGADIAEGIASKNPVQVIQGLAKAVKSILNFNDKKKQRQIAKYQQAVDDLARSFKNLQYETNKALGSDTYKDQRAMLDNLTQQQNEYRKMIKTEQSRKKTDQGKIKEWQQAIIEIDQAKQDLLDSLAQDVLQTNAKDLASTLGDALVEAFGKGEDAAKSFEKVANDVLKNAVLNQLKKQFLEKDLQKALDQLYADMGADNQGNFNFDGLTQAEQQKFKDAIKQISQNFSGALEMYSDLFKDLDTDPNQNSLSGAIAGVSEETASIISGQMNAVRLLIAEANKQRDLTNKILFQQLDRLANIDNNTRVIEPLLTKLINRLDNAGRAYGF